ncbi:MAG: nicotinamidase [Rhodothalassiaceae bacterium]|nr:MAG: nicotinamidase [Rhodothalassiaceae bacterium]
MTASVDLGPGTALIVVDVQRDFCPGGALPVPEGDAVVPVLNRWIAAAEEAGALLVFSRDWHPRGHPSFAAEGGPWPEHCLQDTPGAAFHPALRVPETAHLVSKGTRFDKDQYSAFDETGLAALLAKRGIRRVLIGGLARDVCVKATALDAVGAGFETWLISEGARALGPESGAAADREMTAAGVHILKAPAPGA